jgi:dTDP-4-amino-4,6-dideoxygalactose transaminase
MTVTQSTKTQTQAITIPYSRFKPTGNAAAYISQALESGRVQGDGPFSKKSEALLTDITGSPRVVLTSSGTDALEMAAILAGISPGDEVIMPSFTFVSSANSIVLRGGVPVFVDIDPKTLNIDPVAIKAAITSRTKAIMPVHYAGVACDMKAIQEIARDHQLKIIEDAAHGMGATWKGQHLGAIGDFGALSFHETKNIVAGEGGALLVNDSRAFERCEVVRDKGTNRKQFLRGEVDRYTWVDIGSSFLPGELQAALLASQLEDIKAINSARVAIWNRYHAALAPLESKGLIQRPLIPEGVTHNGHIYWILLKDGEMREAVRRALSGKGIQATSHYECLHKAPIAARFARVSHQGLPVTEHVVNSILRLPLFGKMADRETELVIDALQDALHSVI